MKILIKLILAIVIVIIAFFIIEKINFPSPQKKLDLIVDISMTDNMESLNASVSTAIAMHEIFIKK